MMSVSPTVVPEAGRPAAEPVPAPVPPQLVLVIEDDECVAEISERFLSRLGWRVLRARDGAEGAQMFAEYESEIAIVMLDCGLPDIDGVALCRVMRQHAPQLPVLLTSGWDNEAARELAEAGPTSFLQKPFFPAQIAQHIDALLGTKGSGRTGRAA